MPEKPMGMEWKAGEEGKDEEAPPFDWAKETVRHAGTVVHAWLQRIAEDELRAWDAERIDGLRSRFAIDLQRRGVPPAEMDRAAGIVVSALKNALAEERGRWLLGPHPVVRSEYRLRNRERSFRIDRYFEDADGTKWVVDYKTSEHEGAGVEVFLDLQQERYAAQLDGYAGAAGATRRGLYFPLHKGWREW
jgi:ATP-dependent exoDNAse (exonuclease V) beta subunit